VIFTRFHEVGHDAHVRGCFETEVPHLRLDDAIQRECREEVHVGLGGALQIQFIIDFLHRDIRGESTAFKFRVSSAVSAWTELAVLIVTSPARVS